MECACGSSLSQPCRGRTTGGGGGGSKALDVGGFVCSACMYALAHTRAVFPREVADGESPSASKARGCPRSQHQCRGRQLVVWKTLARFLLECARDIRTPRHHAALMPLF